MCTAVPEISVENNSCIYFHIIIEEPSSLRRYCESVGCFTVFVATLVAISSVALKQDTVTCITARVAGCCYAVNY